LRQLDSSIRDLRRVRESELSERRAVNRTYLKRNPMADLAEPASSSEASEK
jgi:hypothetical protein